MAAHKCLVCSKPITWNFAICTDCEKVYGSKAQNWPTWLRFMWADEQRTRRVERAIAAHEVSIDELSENISEEPFGTGRKTKPIFPGV
jgi:hypothetical protein